MSLGFRLWPKAQSLTPPPRLDCPVGLTNNGSVIRTLTAVGLSLAIPLGALSAPLVHAHPDEFDTDHHRAHEIHAHFTGHSPLPTVPDGARLDDHEAERAISLQVFVAVAQASFDGLAAALPSLQLGTPAEAPAHHSLRIVHGHDPPCISSLGSRAPPAFPS